MLKALSGLADSRKAVLVIVVMVALVTLLALGKIDQERFEAIVKYLLPAWLASHAWEEGKRAEAAGR